MIKLVSFVIVEVKTKKETIIIVSYSKLLKKYHTPSKHLVCLMIILLMAEILHQLIGSLSHYL